MAKSPSRDLVSEQLISMLTKAEKNAVRAFARHTGRSMSSAGRYLIREGLKAEKITFTDEGA
jgi:hypothetical protein